MQTIGASLCRICDQSSVSIVTADSYQTNKMGAGIDRATRFDTKQTESQAADIRENIWLFWFAVTIEALAEAACQCIRNGNLSTTLFQCLHLVWLHTA